MPSSSAIRLQIETALAHRIPSALTPAQKVIRPLALTGVAAVDELLEGGLPVGAITEMAGPECSGRTSLALSFLAGLTRAGRVCAWIDVNDCLHPESAAAVGVELSRLLWVRCGFPAARVEEPARYQFALAEKYFVPAATKQGLHGGGFGPHPRTEACGLSDAVSHLLSPQPPSQQTIAPRGAEPVGSARTKRQAFEPNRKQFGTRRSRRTEPWSRIEQALRVTDLLLQTGGFSAIVLDVASLAPEHVSRVPLATWFRYRAAAERTQASVLLLTQYSCVKSSGELLLRFESGMARKDEATVFTGIEHCVEVERRRFAQAPANVIPLRKPPQRATAAHWRSQSTWAGAR